MSKKLVAYIYPAGFSQQGIMFHARVIKYLHATKMNFAWNDVQEQRQHLSSNLAM